MKRYLLPIIVLMLAIVGVTWPQSPGGSYSSPGVNNLQTVTNYNGQATAGQGVAPILAYNATTPTTPVGSTSILTAAPAGAYRISVYYVVTTAGTVGTAITMNITYTDAQQAQTISTITSSGLVQGQFVTGTLFIQQQASGNINYTITETGSFTVHPVLALKIALERIN